MEDGDAEREGDEMDEKEEEEDRERSPSGSLPQSHLLAKAYRSRLGTNRRAQPWRTYIQNHQ